VNEPAPAAPLLLQEEGASVPAPVPEAPAPADGALLIETLDVERAKAELLPPEAPVAVPGAADLPPAELRAAVEALLFVSTRPLSGERLAACLPGIDAGYIDGFLAGLAARYERERRGWELRRIAHGWQLLTRRDCHAWVRQLDRRELPTRLSRSALETLSIVAYRQPIARGAIEDIRGVQCGPVLRQLMDLRLVQVVGRDEKALGHPLLYGTTEAFLARFGLGSLAELPRKHEFGA
jgi:segregation and condensation protein B